jgi:hypothetical protein
MKHLFNFLLIFAFTTGLVLLQSCEKEILLQETSSDTLADVELKKADGTRTFYGPATSIGKGVARAWVTEDANGNPLEVGLDLTEKVLESLPHDGGSFVLPFHKNKGKHFYDHIYLGWVHMGHEPPGVYDVPHFDVHFYITPSDEREAIGFSPFSVPVDPMYVPPMYLLTDPVIPQMGSHWVDLLAPELDPTSGKKFEHVYIIGSHEGEFIFWEPMVTIEYLLTKPNVTVPVRQPSAWQRDGWYATGYKVKYSDKPGTYTIALTGLTWRNGS